ncbi:MAG: kanamycin nucleotidyltransferase C-terminal domain-containing protein [Bryobacteraceae bacterium]
MLARFGPAAWSRQERLAEASRQSGRLRERHGDDLIAVAVYGETARSGEHPFSGLEMYCLLRGPCDEWLAAQDATVIDAFSADRARDLAREVTPDWPVRQGRFRHAVCIEGAAEIVEELAGLVVSAPPADFDTAGGVLIDELRRDLAALRNARASRRWAPVAGSAVAFTRRAALLAGLVNRWCYATEPCLWEEAGKLARRPDGFDELLRAVTSGSLRDAEKVVAMVERVWLGVWDGFGG